MSLRQYAERRGVSAEAVSKAVACGRLSESVVVVRGQPKIGDVELADREWLRNTTPRAHGHGAPIDGLPPEIPSIAVSTTVAAAAKARRAQADAARAELELAKMKGELVDATEARNHVQAIFGLVKAKLLGIPSKLGQRSPTFAPAVPVVDVLIREVLEELADGDLA